ncbi:MAG: EAL domain-containing protein [Alphaproteobacteria bacterium]|nr:EAL domain-containing protein [Alphaproteobacteria bacterium]
MIEFPPAITERIRQGKIDVCQIQFINLEMVREHAGDRWISLRNKVFNIGEFFISKRMDDRDVVLRCKDGFIVVFYDSSPPPPVERAEDVSLQLNEFFIGEAAFQHLKISCRHLKLDQSEITAFLASQGASLSGLTGNSEKTLSSPAAPGFLSNAEVIFEPVWDSTREAVTTNMALARGVCPETGIRLTGRQLCIGEHERRNMADYDLFVLRATISELGKLFSDHRRAAFSIPIHLQTMLQRDARMEYFSQLREASETMRKLLFFYVEGIAPGTPVSQAEDVFGSLRPLVSGAMAKLGFGVTELSMLDYCKPQLVGWELPGNSAGNELPAIQHSRICGLVRAANARKLKTFLTGVSSMEALRECASIGITFLAGKAIGPSQTFACPPYPMSWPELEEQAPHVL